MRSRRSARFQWRAHKAIWRLSGARIGTHVIGMPVLELVTTGCRSGKPRAVLITYVDHAGSPAVIATNHGADVDPAWVRNLRANPDATIVRRRRPQAVRARFLEGDELETVFQHGVAAYPAYADYRTQANRAIPVVALEVVEPGG